MKHDQRRVLRCRIDKRPQIHEKITTMDPWRVGSCDLYCRTKACGSVFLACLLAEGGLRMQLAEARAAHAKQDSAKRTGTTPQGKQFLLKAEADMQQGNYAGGIQNLQMALTFEPGNEHFKELLEQARKKRG